jgi:hypothetical protein
MHASHPGASRTAQAIVAVPLRKAAACRRSDDLQAHGNARSAACLASRTFSVVNGFAPALPASKPLPKTSRGKRCVPLLLGTRTFAAYFLGGISAGRYREISKPAATWHMIGFVQLFFMVSPLLPARRGRSCRWSATAGTMAHPSRLKWTNERMGSQTIEKQTSEYNNGHASKNWVRLLLLRPPQR